MWTARPPVPSKRSTLTAVEAQSAKYAAGLQDNLPAYRRPLPFLFESNGSVTFFPNDPVPRSRQVFNFRRPETLADMVVQPMQLRARLSSCLYAADAHRSGEPKSHMSCAFDWRSHISTMKGTQVAT